MTQRRLSLALAALLTAVGTTSCNSLFADAPIDKISAEANWQNSQLLDEYTLSWYRNMSHGFTTYVPTSALLKGISRYYLPWFGDQLTVGKTDWFNAGYGDILKDNTESITLHASNQWTAYYTQIQYINTFLANRDKVADGAQKQRIEGEAHFFRAYYYYLLWRRYGGVLLIDAPYDPLRDGRKFARASYQQMVDFIAAEAEAAAQLLPTTLEASQTGRATKGAALMLKAKAYLWAAGQQFQNAEKPYLGFTDDQSRPMLEQAKRAYDQLMALGVYRLVPITAATQDGIAEEYRQIFIKKNTAESIFEVQHSDDGDYANKFGHQLDKDAAAPSFTGTVAAYTPTQNHVDEYGMRECATYDANRPYEMRDYRFYANVLYDGCTFRGHVMDIHYNNNVAGADLTPHGTSTSAATTRTGYYLGKFVDATQAIDDNETYASRQNYPIWRWAEALLDMAEVAYRLGDAATATQRVNEVRTRVHMHTLPSVTWEQIANERRVELAFEETTYWDMIRWCKAQQQFSGESNPLKAMRIDERNGQRTYRVSNLNRFPGRVRLFSPRNYYYPIPWSEVRYQGIDQNPGWNEI